MKMKIAILLPFCVICGCAWFVATSVNQDIYVSTSEGKGFKFAEDKNAHLCFEYEKGDWKIVKENPVDVPRGFSRTIWFQNRKDSIQIGYVIFKFTMPYSIDGQLSHLKEFEEIRKKQFSSKPNTKYELIGFNIGKNITPNYLYTAEDGISKTFRAEFYSGPYLVMLRIDSITKNEFSKEDFMKFFETVKIIDNLKTMDISKYKKFKDSEL
jgi:hypothetical protein